MLVPLELYKDEVIKLFQGLLYSQQYYYYNGCDSGSLMPDFAPHENRYMYAIIDDDSNVTGYFSYWVTPTTDTACNFGVINLKSDGSLSSTDVLKEMKRLINRYHKVEWCVVDGNPVKKVYDKFCKKYHGHISRKYDAVKDLDGKYRDIYTYEIIKGRDLSKECE